MLLVLTSIQVAMLICVEAIASGEVGLVKRTYNAKSSISVRRAGRRNPFSVVHRLLLALESSEVIGRRIAKLAGGGVDARYCEDLQGSPRDRPPLFGQRICRS
jgi:hypothetical protein